MKKIIATLLTVLILTASFLSLTAFAWGDPQLMLAAEYNEEDKTITLLYRVLELPGTESADFRLKYNPDVVEMKDYKTAKMDNVVMEVGQMIDKKDTIAIQFIDLYCVTDEDCEEDGSATLVTFTFNVINENATETVFISNTDSYNMDPDSIEIRPERATLKIPLNEGSTSKATVENFNFDSKAEESSNLTKIIIAAVVTAIVFITGLIAIVVKFRKS